MQSAFRQTRNLKSLQKSIELVSKRTAFFKRKPEVINEEGHTARKRDTRFDGPSTEERFQSLETHSFGRPSKGYSPPGDVEERIQRITQEVCGDSPAWRDLTFTDRRVKFKILTRCIAEFNHDIPNPDLSDISSTEDLINYYQTPLHDKTSYENLASLDLPRNLHIQKEYLRFDPDTDTMFGGKNAFPGRPIIITSLRAKRKYKGTNIPEFWRDQHLDE